MPRSDSAWLARAAALALRGFPAPNPRVGCVVVRDGKAVGAGHHDHAGGPHAEVVALAQAGPLAMAATLYVTLEPCAHHGRTPPCTEAIVAARIARVVYGAPDPNPEAQGGADALCGAGIEAEWVPCALCEAANAVFLHAHRLGRAYVMAKMAATADGFAARPGGAGGWITGPAARAAGHGLRAEAGAVLVGAGTAVHDRPRLSVRAFSARNQPARFVLDPRRRATAGAPPFDGEAPARRIVAEPDAVPGELGVPSGADGLDCEAIARALFAEGLTAVLVEGGPETVARFGASGVLDRLDLFVSQERSGGGTAFAVPPGLVAAGSRSLDGDAWLTFLRPGCPSAVPAWAESSEPPLLER